MAIPPVQHKSIAICLQSSVIAKSTGNMPATPKKWKRTLPSKEGLIAGYSLRRVKCNPDDVPAMASMNTISDVTAKSKNSETYDSSLPPLPAKRTVVGVGTLTLDFLAKVESYSEPDAKIRTKESLAQGGGNVGNALTAAARLGLNPRVFSKVANDSAGTGIPKELECDAVDVSVTEL